jgi:guanidinoacetate N-methyltransferase
MTSPLPDWQRPLLRMLARNAAAGGGDLLEVGFGTGISAEYVQDVGVRSHTIIEADDRAAAEFQRWRMSWPDRDIRFEPGYWEDVIDRLGRYDAVLFDTYPTDEREFLRTLGNTAAVHATRFFEPSLAHLHPGGRLSYYTNEVDSLGRGHQRALLDSFSSFTVQLCRGLRPPPECNYWWAPTMAVVTAQK